MLKLCSACDQYLPRAAFALCRKARTGLQGYCRQCNQAGVKRMPLRPHALATRAMLIPKVQKPLRPPRPRPTALQLRAKRSRVGLGKVTASTASVADICGIYAAQAGRCGISGRPIAIVSMELDHIVPRSRGGGSEATNLRWVCREANLAKSSMTDEELLAICRDVLGWMGDACERIRYGRVLGSTAAEADAHPAQITESTPRHSSAA